MPTPVTPVEVYLQQILDQLTRVGDLLEGAQQTAQPTQEPAKAPEAVATRTDSDKPAGGRTRTRTRRTSEGGRP